jgi:hypothetical protein
MNEIVFHGGGACCFNHFPYNTLQKLIITTEVQLFGAVTGHHRNNESWIDLRK